MGYIYIYIISFFFFFSDVPSETNLVTVEELIPGLQSSPPGEGELLHCSIKL